MIKQMKKHQTLVGQSIKETEHGAIGKLFHLNKGGFFDLGTQKSIGHEMKSSIKMEESGTK